MRKSLYILGAVLVLLGIQAAGVSLSLYLGMPKEDVIKSIPILLAHTISTSAAVSIALVHIAVKKPRIRCTSVQVGWNINLTVHVQNRSREHKLILEEVEVRGFRTLWKDKAGKPTLEANRGADVLCTLVRLDDHESGSFTEEYSRIPKFTGSVRYRYLGVESFERMKISIPNHYTEQNSLLDQLKKVVAGRK